MSRLRSFLPVLVFAGVAAGLYVGLGTDTRTIPSVLIGKPAPALELKPVSGFSVPGFGPSDLSGGKVSLVNLFGSWCAPCRDEHPMLMELARRNDIQILGINTKDTPSKAFAFLTELGQPYDAIGEDRDGRAVIEWGGYGVPETFVIDGKGIIRFKLIGPITKTNLPVLLEEISKAAKPS
jgi:cytochrome c biogenesis protein CcmG, thiol:disulfide interchange protein DsbE